MTYTTTEAAKLLGVARPTITLHCRRLRLPKHGPAWLIDDEGLQRLRESIRGKVGNPNWVRTDT